MAENHVSGMGCKCSAWSENECCCEGVDWRSAREVELEEECKLLKDKVSALHDHLNDVRHCNCQKRTETTGGNANEEA